FSSRRRHTRSYGDWSSDVCSSDLVLEGALHFWFGEDGAEELTVRAGEVIVIPSFLAHRALALEDTLDVDVFCPPRQDWLAGTDRSEERRVGKEGGGGWGAGPDHEK